MVCGVEQGVEQKVGQGVGNNEANGWCLPGACLLVTALRTCLKRLVWSNSGVAAGKGQKE